MALPMGSIAGKNLTLSNSASDLGLGDSLVQQMQDLDAQRRKKQIQNPGSAIQDGSMMSPAVQSLLSRSTGGLGGIVGQ